MKKERRLRCFLGLLVLVISTSSTVSSATCPMSWYFGGDTWNIDLCGVQSDYYFQKSLLGMSNGIATQMAILGSMLIH